MPKLISTNRPMGNGSGQPFRLSSFNRKDKWTTEELFILAREDLTDYQKANWGSYLGFSVGELKKKGDWALDANYQFLAAQCVPDFDASGVGLGNINNSGFYTTQINNNVLTTRADAGGNVNFRGIAVTLDYLISNNLNLQQQWLQSVTLDNDIGPYRKFKQYEIEFIYGF